MWLFTKVGFFSIVEHEGHPDEMVVRARVKKDLDDLRNKYMPDLSKTIYLETRDYPYRGFIGKDKLALAMARIALDIDYGNFKSMVSVTQGAKRMGLYSEVWSVMVKAEEDPNRIQKYYQTGFDEEYFARRYGGRSTIRTLPSVTGPDYEFFPYHSSDYDGKYKLVETPGKKRKRRRRNRR